MNGVWPVWLAHAARRQPYGHLAANGGRLGLGYPPRRLYPAAWLTADVRRVVQTCCAATVLACAAWYNGGTTSFAGWRTGWAAAWPG